MAIAVVLLFMYLLPTGLAWSRKHYQSGSILLLNLLLGWTVVGWIVSLVWAATDPSPPNRRTVIVTVPGAVVTTTDIIASVAQPDPPTWGPPIAPPFDSPKVLSSDAPIQSPASAGEPGLFCPHCGKKRERTLTFCRHCQASLV